MKLLIDQNISYRLVKQIQNLFPGSEHVSKLKLENESDLLIWRFAREILTFDSDYFDLNTLLGSPPKVIWLRTGNSTTVNITRILLDRAETIRQYLSDPSNAGCLQIID